MRFWLKLIERDIHLITRLTKEAAIQAERVFTKICALKDSLIGLGSGTAKTPFITWRLILKILDRAIAPAPCELGMSQPDLVLDCAN